MKKVWGIYGTTLFLLCLFAYRTGRSGAAKELLTQPNQPVTSTRAQTVPEELESGSASFPNLRVTGFATINFAEAADIMQRVFSEQKESWAREIAALPEGPQKRLAAIGFYATWIQFDAPAACASIASFGDMLLRDVIVGSVSAAAPAGAIPELAESLLQFTSIERRRALPGVLREWAISDPAAAARFITQHPDKIEGDEVERFIADWTELDPTMAQAWLEQNENLVSNEKVVSAFVQKWLELDSAPAIEYVRAHAGSDAFAGALRAVVALSYRGGIEQALQFVESLPEESRSTAFQNLLGAAEEDSASLSRIVDWASRVSLRYRDEQVRSALSMWASTDEESALQWVSHHPPAEREQWTREFCSSGVSLTPGTASLVLSLTKQSDREEAMRNLLQPFAGETEEARHVIVELHLSHKQTSALLRLAGVEQ